MPATEKISISLPAEIVRVIRAKVESGGYGSNSEVICEAMRGWLERERHFTTLNDAVERGIADATAGRVKDSEQIRKSLLSRIDMEDTQPQP